MPSYRWWEWVDMGVFPALGWDHLHAKQLMTKPQTEVQFWRRGGEDLLRGSLAGPSHSGMWVRGTSLGLGWDWSGRGEVVGPSIYPILPLT